VSALALAPFSHLIDPKDDFVMIYCGRRAWKLAAPAKNRVASLAFPRNRDPADFKWPVEGKTVLVFSGGEPDEMVDLLVIELLRAGAKTVHARYRDESLIEYDPRDRAPR
jgi:hypothetical protein